MAFLLVIAALIFLGTIAYYERTLARLRARHAIEVEWLRSQRLSPLESLMSSDPDMLRIHRELAYFYEDIVVDTADPRYDAIRHYRTLIKRYDAPQKSVDPS